MRRPAVPIALCLVLAACTARSPVEVVPDPPPTVAPPSPGTLVTTYPGSDGTRLATGIGRLPATDPIDVELPGTPVWVVGVPGAPTSFLVAVESGELVEIRGDGELLPAGELTAFAPPIVSVAQDGTRTVAWDRPTAVDADAPPDARPLRDGDRVLLVTGATTRYPHGALGDAVEGSSVTIIEGGVATTLIELPDPEVFEGTTPMWADFDRDGSREILLTASRPTDGARLVLYDDTGRVVAEGPAVGRGNRWRHQVAAAPFGPDGEIEIAAVETPHIGGTVQFYRWVEDRLEIVASVRGFSSHRFLSPNLDMALAADADGDGRIELVVPTDDYTELGGIRRTADGAEVAWIVPIGDRITTNIATVAMMDGSLSFAAGRADGLLRIWP